MQVLKRVSILRNKKKCGKNKFARILNKPELKKSSKSELRKLREIREIKIDLFVIRAYMIHIGSKSSA